MAGITTDIVWEICISKPWEDVVSDHDG